MHYKSSYDSCTHDTFCYKNNIVFDILPCNIPCVIFAIGNTNVNNNVNFIIVIANATTGITFVLISARYNTGIIFTIVIANAATGTTFVLITARFNTGIIFIIIIINIIIFIIANAGITFISIVIAGIFSALSF